jgi:hypothetical protein
MRRLRRLTLAALTWLSLLLCLATAALWVRSYWVGEAVRPRTGEWIWVLNSVRGSITIGSYRPSPNFQVPPYTRFVPLPAPSRPNPPADPRVPIDWHVMGFGLRITRGGTLTTRSGRSTFFPGWMAVTPHAALVVVFAALPAVRFRPRRRRTPGLCATCGYDLRATPERCPECGAVPAATQSPAGASRND